jgi:hypothetical protein
MDSPHTDPESHRWLRWASESGSTPTFVRTVAEAALIARSPDYVLLRPGLVELKRRYGSAASRGFSQLHNEFLTAARRVATTKKQAIGEVVEWVSAGSFKYGDIGRMTEVDTPKLRAATELMTSTLADTSC